MFPKKNYFIFILFILLIFGVLTYQGIKGGSEEPEFNVTNYPLVILERGIFNFSKSVKKFFQSYILIVGKEEENRRLLAQVELANQEVNEYIEAKNENERLRELLELKSQRPDYITSADVFARDPTNWFQILWINKGEKDGISRDMVAVTPSGAVGRVFNILNNTASIVLITDVNSSVAVRTQTTRIEGIMEGRGDDRCYLKYVPQDIVVKIGEKLLTSGLDGIYPEGVLIGHVTDVKKRDGEPFLEIEVSTAQNLNAVEEVAILKR